MGISIFVKNGEQQELCNISKFRAEMEKSGDKGFAEFMSRELVGNQVELHICHSTWARLLTKMGLSCDSSSGSMDPDTLGLGISQFQLSANSGDTEGSQWIEILKNIVRHARNLNSTVVWG